MAPASIAVGIAISVTGYYRWALWSGWVLTTLGMGLLYLQDVHTPTVSWIFLNLVPGLGTGILFAGMGIAIPAAADPVDMAHAVAFFSFFRAFGQGIGVAIGGAIFTNQMRQQLEKYPLLAPLAAKYSSDAAGLVPVIKAMEAGPAKEQLIQGYADSLKIVWITMCGLAAIGLVSNFFVKHYTLDVAQQTEQGFVDKDKLPDAEAAKRSEKSTAA